MKAGTTSVFNDLLTHPEIFLPEQKEPELLLRHTPDEAVVEAYRSLMRKAAPGQLKGEASTGYTKRPDSEGCAERARRILGADVRIVYFEREPIARAISHYRHDFVAGMQTTQIDEALVSDSRYIDYGRYDWQIAPWVEAFGAAQVLRLRFEDYTTDRAGVLTRVLVHIGASPAKLVLGETRVHNSSSDKYVGVGLSKMLIESRFFQFHVKPLFPRPLRQAMIPLLTQKARPSEREISESTRSYLIDQLSR